MKNLILTLIALTSLNARAATLPLNPAKVECRVLTDLGTGATSTAIYNDDELLYHGYWVTQDNTSRMDMLRCDGIITKAKSLKKSLMLDLAAADDGNAASINVMKWNYDSHWRQDDFFYVEGTLPASVPRCRP